MSRRTSALRVNVMADSEAVIRQAVRKIEHELDIIRIIGGENAAQRLIAAIAVDAGVEATIPELESVPLGILTQPNVDNS